MNNEKDKGMSLIVKTVTRLTAGPIFLYGIYILSHGHVSPGGGFVGGVIIALAFIQLMLAYGKESAFKKLPRAAASFIENLGALMFLALAGLGFTGGYFLLNFIGKGEPFRLFSAGIMPLYNIAIGVKVGAGLFAIFIALILLRINREDDR
jgi:multicomponent Na+:H+ antiporter subunit B